MHESVARGRLCMRKIGRAVIAVSTVAHVRLRWQQTVKRRRRRRLSVFKSSIRDIGQWYQWSLADLYRYCAIQKSSSQPQLVHNFRILQIHSWASKLEFWRLLLTRPSWTFSLHLSNSHSEMLFWEDKTEGLDKEDAACVSEIRSFLAFHLSFCIHSHPACFTWAPRSQKLLIRSSN